MMENTINEPPQDILTGFEISLQRAGIGKRFNNYLIDFFAFYLVATLLVRLYYMVAGSLEHYHSINPLGSLLDSPVDLLLYAIFSGLIEGIFKGKSLGKLITRTRAVNMDGTNISFMTAFVRGLSRIVPLEPFSALGSGTRPWHDKWTDTYVIDEKTSIRKLA